MIMRKNEGIKLPIGYVCLMEEEMARSEGGSINIGMTRGYLSKTICLDQARGVIRTYKWKNVTGGQLAREIYGHAMVYFRWGVLGDIPIINNLVYSHVADGVDLDNKVDKYQTVWDFLWDF